MMMLGQNYDYREKKNDGKNLPVTWRKDCGDYCVVNIASNVWF